MPVFRFVDPEGKVHHVEAPTMWLAYQSLFSELGWSILLSLDPSQEFYSGRELTLPSDDPRQILLLQPSTLKACRAVILALDVAKEPWTYNALGQLIRTVPTIFRPAAGFDGSVHDRVMELFNYWFPNWWQTHGLCGRSAHATIGPDYNALIQFNPATPIHSAELEAMKRKFPEAIWHAGMSSDIAPGPVEEAGASALLSSILKSIVWMGEVTQGIPPDDHTVFTDAEDAAKQDEKTDTE